MFFRETKETEEDIRRMFHYIRERMKLRITLKKKSDPRKFAIPSCHCGAEYETEYSESIDTHTITSINSNESTMTDERYPTSLDGMQPVDHSTLPDHWADSEFHESFALETVILSSNEDPTEEYDEDYWKERASVDTHPNPAKRSSASIDTTHGTSIDIKTVASEKEKGNIPIPNRFPNTYIRSFAPHITSHELEAEKMNAPTNQSEGTPRKSIRSKNPNSADKRLPSIDTPVSTSIDSHSKPKLSLSTTKNMSIDYDFLLPDEFGIFRDQDGHARAMDGRILQVSRKDIADILQVANGPDNLFTQQCSNPDNNPAVPDEHSRATTTLIGAHQTCKPVSNASIDEVVSKSFDRVTPKSIDKAHSPPIDRLYECGRRTYDSYGARKFKWEQKDEYGVYRDESGHARSAAGDMIPVTNDDIRKILERASLFGESHTCLTSHATSFKPTNLTPEIYTKDEINEMVTGICGAQEKLGDELKTLVEDTYQPLDRGYNELFRCMVEMRTEIESMQYNLENEATTSPSIDANKATSIDVKQHTSQIPAEPKSLAEKNDEWEIAYINTRINDVYNPLNNNMDWLSTRIDLLHQELDTIRMNDPQPAT
ncbi:hypothetical protein F2Q69_00030550 [Brassica cretica]|uniref:Uncharacterized protein n=1 Tax=Brassica cretica TaxID=69181 RepID=A0A8S9RSH8_BRACR|nr:hypothetical protein F2Q69_00030550 [Brassica cretica]